MAIGSEEVREALFQEMKEDILEMSKSSYASFFVKKLLKYGTKEQRAFVFKQMEGRVAKLMKHKLAGFVVEMAYNDYANAAQRNCMLQVRKSTSWAITASTAYSPHAGVPRSRIPTV